MGVYPGDFNYARCLTVDNSCNVYVADGLNNRVQKFSSMGALLGHWGTAGAGPGQFSDPWGVAVDALGGVYVTDFGNHRVQKFTDSGVYQTQWGQLGSDDGYFAYPMGVAADPFGYVYTAEPHILGGDPSNVRIQRFTNTGAFIAKWPGHAPTDVAIDNAGNIFVTDSNAVIKYASTGTQLALWGSYGSGAGQFNFPAGLCVDDTGNVYVADTGNHRIQKFTGTGTFVTQWGSNGTAPGQFRYPSDVAVDDSGSVYVADRLNFRIQKFRVGPPQVLLVHGICGSASNWDPFAQVLSDSGFVVDRLQYGSSSYSLRPAAYVSALAAKLDAMGPGPIAVVAHSMGGLIAREYIRRQVLSGQLNKVTHLITLGTPHHGSDLLAKVLGWGPVVDQLLRPIFGPCLGSNYSKPALLDTVPGAWYLNRLNYGVNSSLNDPLTDHGWSSHNSETELPADVYFATIAGTGSFCDDRLRGILWPRDAAYHPNDCTVATGGSLLSNTATFRATDPSLGLEKPAAHTDRATEPCGEAYYSYGTLAMRVATILATSPAMPPLSLPEEQPSSGPTAISATVEDSLQMAPAIADYVLAGTVVDKPVVLPATSRVRFTLLSTDAHVSLVNPNGVAITVADTSTAAGISFFTTGDPGFEGFEIIGPVAGTWTVRINASGSAVGQRVAGIVEYASENTVQLSVLTSPIYSGDVMRVRGQWRVFDDIRRTDVAWTCEVLGPDATITALALFDDGSHADSLAGDGIYGNTASLAGGVGQYALTATASAPGVGPLAAVAYCELAASQDLAVGTSDISLSRNVPEAGDALMVLATVHNNSSMAAIGVPVVIRELPTGMILGSSTIDLAAGMAVLVQAPWTPAAPDSHVIQVQVSPTILDEINYANNTASRLIVLGTPLRVPGEGGSTRLRFDPPYPNPTSRGVVFSFRVPESKAGSLSVYDISGRRVRGWQWAMLLPGSHSLNWDGRGTSGHRVRPGLYVCRLEVGGERLQRKIILWR
jgi:pimeloyl-ACP methyl ester carboxylesterase